MSRKKVALILSGAGNRGALQVGALLALFERDFHPDMLIGTSSGALNAAFLAPNPTLAQARRLASVWNSCTKENVYPGSRLKMAWRALRGAPSLFSSENFRQFLLDNNPPRVERFRDVSGIELYIVAAHRSNGGLRVFGDNPDESILDALLASTAIPPLLPPWKSGEEVLIDGGVVSNPAVSVALARGATEIWTIHIQGGPPERIPADNLFGVSLRVIVQAMARASEEELSLLNRIGGKLITVGGFDHLPPWDYDYTAAMIETGYRQACTQLGSLFLDAEPLWRKLFHRILPESRETNSGEQCDPIPALENPPQDVQAA